VIPVAKADGTGINSSVEALGIAPVIQQMLTADDITVSLIDKVTNTTYASVKNCRFQGRSMSLSAQSLANQRITLMGIYESAGGTNSPGQLGF
jgi:hypothetical protein